jgi:cytochrome oxidase Cu insertion factor (SCO1/SenC/PrrC family)
MTDRTKIILIYTVVAVLSATVLGTSFWLRESRKRRFTPIVADAGGEVAEDFGSLAKDLALTNQEGEVINLSDLQDKVWIATNFFATCPYCLETAAEDLRSLYNEFSAEDDFHVVSISIDPETDQLEQLQDYASAVDADSSNWWFVRGEEKVIHDYLEKEMGFMKVVKNKVPPAKTRYSHDRSLMVFDGWQCVKKRDLQFARSQGEKVRESYYQDVRQSILKGLASRRLSSGAQR